MTVKDAPDPAATPAADTRQRIKDLSLRIERLHRCILEPEVLGGLLPVRARTLAHRSEQPEARTREARFCAASPAYAAAVDDATPLAQSRVIELQRLNWWVPLLRPDDQAYVERYLTHQDFPYRAIAQTREVAMGFAMLDIGANIGRMSIPRVILGDIQVAYCAEPDPLNYTCLVRNVRDNAMRGLVLADQLAIGSEDGTVHLERAKSAGGHRVIDGAVSKRETVEVPSLTLDTWVHRIGLDLQQLAFVKVDAQGSEVHVLRGAGSVLRCGHVAWQIEIDPPLLGKRGFQADDVMAILRQHFTHFVDLNRTAAGPRVRPVAEMREALAYIIGPSDGRTDVLVFRMEP